MRCLFGELHPFPIADFVQLDRRIDLPIAHVPGWSRLLDLRAVFNPRMRAGTENQIGETCACRTGEHDRYAGNNWAN